MDTLAAAGRRKETREMNDKAIMEREAFSGPSALDLYAGFSKRYGALIDGRVKQLRDQLAEDPNPSPQAQAMWDELDRFRSFEQELHRLIRAFVDDAVKPMQEALLASMRYHQILTPPPAIFGSSPAAEDTAIGMALKAAAGERNRQQGAGVYR